MSADSIILLDKAIECAKPFYEISDRPDCIEWRKLLEDTIGFVDRR